MAPKRNNVAALPAVLAILVFAGVCVVPRAAWAHAVGLSRGEYAVGQGGTLTADITFARGEVVGIVPALDPDKDGTIEERDVARARADLERIVLGGFEVRAGDRACTPKLEGASLTEQDGL